MEERRVLDRSRGMQAWSRHEQCNVTRSKKQVLKKYKMMCCKAEKYE
jgi:hypothetical protein